MTGGAVSQTPGLGMLRRLLRPESRRGTTASPVHLRQLQSGLVVPGSRTCHAAQGAACGIAPSGRSHTGCGPCLRRRLHKTRSVDGHLYRWRGVACDL
eukprot:2632378-Pyramimonas_sp.AAC.1